MRALVAGAGAVGSWLGAGLAAGGAEVTLVARGSKFDALSEGGLRRRVDGSVQRFDVKVLDSISRAAASGPFDCTLVTVKSYHTTAIAEEIAAAGLRGPFISFQNGIGNESMLDAIITGGEAPSGVALARVPSYPGTPVIAATLTSAVQMIERGIVQLRGSAKSGVGLPSRGEATSDRLAAALVAGGVTVRRYSDPDAMKWSKLLLNMLGAATSAIVRRPPSEILARRDVFAIEYRAWREAIAVMRRLGLSAEGLPGYPVDRYAAAASALPAPLLGALFSRRLARARGDRLPGTAADIIAGRVESEIHAMHGIIAEVGSECGVATPVCAALCDLVDGIARSRIPAERFAGNPRALAEAVLNPSKPART